MRLIYATDDMLLLLLQSNAIAANQVAVSLVAIDVLKAEIAAAGAVQNACVDKDVVAEETALNRLA